MERYNKIFLAFWVLLSAVIFAFLGAFVLGSLPPIFDVEESLEGESLAVSFLLFFLLSEVIGFLLARTAVERIGWANRTPSFSSMN